MSVKNPKNLSASTSEPQQHYVYVYRDGRRKIRYVGYGKSNKRAPSHLSRSHNQLLSDLLAHEKCSLEIAGPFDSERTGRAVETALISAIDPDCNRTFGSAQWRFRPLGVPKQFAGRLDLEPLTRDDFFKHSGARRLDSVLFVRINDQDFSDGRVGYNPAKPPSDDQILERMDCWWQLNPYIDGWLKDRSKCPGMLLGVSGAPGYQIIIGAVNIDHAGWRETGRCGALYQVPTAGPKDLDALGLRGRRVSINANIKFGPNRSQTILILDRAGKVTGGRPSSRG